MTSSARGTNSRVIPGDDGVRRWHVAAYLAGRNDLERELARQARALDQRVPSDAVAVSVLVAGRTSWQRLAGDRRRPWDGDTGDPRSLTAFVTAAARASPDHALALVIGSHGQGWSADAGPGALAYDRRTGSALSTRDLGRALAALHRRRGRRLELLVLDACLMATVETVVEVAHHVDVLVAPASRTGRSGVDHAAVVDDLARTSARTVADDADDADDVDGANAVDGPAAAARTWIAGWGAPGSERPGPRAPTAVTAVRGAGAPALTAALDHFGTALRAGEAGGDAAVIEAARLDAARPAPGLTDLGSFAGNVARATLRSPAHRELRAAAEAVRAVLVPGGPLVVETTAGGRRQAMGLTVTLGSAGRPAQHTPRQLQAARISGWSSFLDSCSRSPAVPS